MRDRRMNEKTKKRLMRTAVAVSWMVIVCFGLAAGFAGYRVFICDRFVVPSSSMEPTLQPGDRILVDKLIFGARIYKNYDFSPGRTLSSWRMPGLRGIRPGDVLVFNAPHGLDDGKIAFRINYVYSKRCVGTPGDTVDITGAPLYIPRKGDTIRLDGLTPKFYTDIVEYETGRDPNDIPGGEYVFRGDYYYVTGDNLDNSSDSRHWGFVPEEFIIGVARRIVWHRDPDTGNFRRDRLWKKIR